MTIQVKNKNLTKSLFKKSNFSRSNSRGIPVFWKIMGYLCKKISKIAWQIQKRMLYYTKMLQGGAVVARQAHNLKAVGSIPAPATKWLSASQPTGFFLALNPLVSEGFTILPNSLLSFKNCKNAPNLSLILCLVGDRRSTPSAVKKS